MWHVAHRVMNKVMAVAFVAGLVSASIQDARAEQWSVPNQAGGRIVLNTAQCNYSKVLMIAQYYNGDGEVHWGCWNLEDADHVEVTWDDRTTRIYPREAFRADEIAPITKQSAPATAPPVRGTML
jgi:hypothetical protein